MRDRRDHRSRTYALFIEDSDPSRMSFLRKDVARFVIVGSLGFVIDSGSLATLVHGANWNPFLARAVGMAFAILCTWSLHRHWTFSSGRLRSPLPQSLLYGTFQMLSVSVNYGIFSALVLTGGLWRSYPVLAAVAGSLSAAVITYVLSKWITFAEPRDLANVPASEGIEMVTSDRSLSGSG